MHILRDSLVRLAQSEIRYAHWWVMCVGLLVGIILTLCFWVFMDLILREVRFFLLKKQSKKACLLEQAIKMGEMDDCTEGEEDDVEEVDLYVDRPSDDYR